MLVLFWARLRARGYPAFFLCGLFAQAPTFDQREALLYKEKLARQGRMQCLITEYSNAKHRLQLGEIMHANKHLLPSHLQGEFVLAYRALPKLGAQLCTYRFPRTERAQQTQLQLPPSPRFWVPGWSYSLAARAAICFDAKQSHEAMTE